MLFTAKTPGEGEEGNLEYPPLIKTRKPSIVQRNRKAGEGGVSKTCPIEERGWRVGRGGLVVPDLAYGNLSYLPL